ncbi:AAA family ATPase [Hydrogenobaculum acidophilum]
MVIQTILFGPPGAGKSYFVNHTYLKCLGIDSNEQVVRIAFYPEYKYADFVGRLIPRTTKNNNVYYEFVAGPFLEILKDAYKSYLYNNKNHLLVIEEINRGNASAIFGDLIVLLDRNDKGISEYFVNLPALAGEWLYKELSDKWLCKGLSDSNSINESKKFEELFEINRRKKRVTRIKLPPNLHLIATMNSSDESIFFLDNAFKRRWTWRYID